MKTVDDILWMIVRCTEIIDLCRAPATCCIMHNIAYDMILGGEY